MGQSKGTWDIVVIGAGIQGASVAEEAAAGGYRVLVIDSRAPAWGTSSRSSKLIHGGLRYLETGQIRLVHECLRERAILLRRAPDLVRLKPFYIPVYRHTRRHALTIAAGLGLYAVLAKLGAGSRFSRLPPSQAEALDGLSSEGLKHIFQYHDAQTDDAALTRAVLSSACEMGAHARYPVSFEAAEPSPTGWVVRIKDGGRDEIIHCHALVNATGPWVNDTLARISAAHPAIDVELVAGTHVIYERPVEQGIYYVEASDRRAVFVMPWKGGTMVGTTERTYQGDPADIAPTEHEIAYLHDTLSQYFPAFADEQPSDAFAGLRVLPAAPTSPFKRARETRLERNDMQSPPLVSIYGGKLTAARATGEAVMESLSARLPQRARKNDTKTRRLYPVD